MGELVEGDDRLPAEDVGAWAKEKLEYLRRYIDISRGVRAKYLPPQGNGGSCYIDLFCGPGRSLVRDSGEWIDGSPIAAWRKSRETGTPFSKVIIADIDKTRLDAATARLEALGAPVVPLLGPATETVQGALTEAAAHGLNFAFIDPFSIGALDFEILKALSQLKRIDVLVHVSKMDLQRNLPGSVASEESQFDLFAPNWRDNVNLNQLHPAIRRAVFEYWRRLVASTGIATSDETKLITGSRGQHLYWLLLAAKHDLAHRFWKESAKGDQGSLF